MRLSPYRIRSKLLTQQGSSTVGFVLIVPLVISVFFAVIQIANLVNVRTALQAAANSGARIASRYDGNLADGELETTQQLSAQGIVNDLTVSSTHISNSGFVFAQVRVQHGYQIPWLGISLNLSAVGKSVDEKWL